ncbi:hypothetical protein H6G33_32280 [Calothrix sp. FACHB-1219]|uniref:hypothetical protein n=1 Tax=unclassified Calothrix TaxID=2619626 RepID=UPI001686093B|nr:MULTISPECIES: hypothetical protein [unclassified Calothrix]MBD2207032.1 hypothetical protein [Calothrix sp. FACHB-168]MBD2221648.1 hypothetical protein [Calothrix sp. FACHB-1219]
MQNLRIHQFNAEYNISRSLDNPSSLQRRLDRIAQEYLTAALENQLQNLHNNDKAIICIEQMEVNLTLDLFNLDDRQIAATWSNALLAAINKILSQQGSSVIIFSNRGEFIASFLEELLRGKAWDYWYYQEFGSLQSVSLGEAIFRVLIEDGDTGLNALLELTRRNRLDLLLTILSDAEVDLIVNQCLLPPSPRIILPNTFPVWVQQLRAILDSGFTLTSQPSRNIARLYLNLLRQYPQLGPDVNLARFIKDLLQLRDNLSKISNKGEFISHLQTENWNIAFSLLGRGSTQQFLTNLMREFTGTEVVNLLRSLQLETTQPVTQRIITPFGGLFLLIGAIIDLKIDNFLQNCPYPEPQGIPNANFLIWLIALQCLGKSNCQQTMGDRGLALFAGLSQPPQLEILHNYLASLTTEMHAAFTNTFAEHLSKILKQPSLFIYRHTLASASPMNLANSDRQWDSALVAVSSIILRGFTVKLGAFADSSPEYLRRNFLESRAEIEISHAEIRVLFITCPLQTVLRMAGFDSNTWEVPWLENRQLKLEFN